MNTWLNYEKLTDLTIVTVRHVPAYLKETLLSSTIPPEGSGRLAVWRCSLEETVTLEEHQFYFPQDVGFYIAQCNDCTPWCCLQRIQLMIILETRSAQKCKHVTQSIHHGNHKTQTPLTMNRQRTLPLPGAPGEKQQLEPTIESKQ